MERENSTDIVIESLDNKTENCQRSIDTVYDNLDEQDRLTIDRCIVGYYMVTGRDLHTYRAAEFSPTSTSEQYETAINMLVTAKASAIVAHQAYGMRKGIMLYRNKDGTKVVSEDNNEISFLHYVYSEVQDEIQTFTCRDCLYTEHEITKVAAYTVLERRNNGMAIAVTTKNMFVSSLYDNITLISFYYTSSNPLCYVQSQYRRESHITNIKRVVNVINN